jgi:hypothetical protein
VTREIEIGGRPRQVGPNWFRGAHCNFSPNVANMRSSHAVEDFILDGWLPSEPFIAPETKITAFGSCFAEHISNYLNRRNYTILTKSDANAHVVDIGEGMVHSYAIRQQFDWAFRGITPTTGIWHGYQAEEYDHHEATRLATRDLFEQTDVFILTFGLSEVWYDEPTGEVFWRAVPAEVFEPDRHKFRVTTVAENVSNMRAVYDTIREFRPDARIIFTLSPIPLTATFRPVSCITATVASKAILRAAIDELHREVADEGKLFYWPSYEIVEQAFGPGRYESDRRHIKGPILDYIMTLFETHYCVGSTPASPLAEARLVAMQAAGDLSDDALRAASARNPRAISSWVLRRLAADDVETAEFVLAYSISLYPDDHVRRQLMDRVRRTQPRPEDSRGRTVKLALGKRVPHRGRPLARRIKRQADVLIVRVRGRIGS